MFVVVSGIAFILIFIFSDAGSVRADCSLPESGEGFLFFGIRGYRAPVDSRHLAGIYTPPPPQFSLKIAEFLRSGNRYSLFLLHSPQSARGITRCLSLSGARRYGQFARTPSLVNREQLIENSYEIKDKLAGRREPGYYLLSHFLSQQGLRADMREIGQHAESNLRNQCNKRTFDKRKNVPRSQKSRRSFFFPCFPYSTCDFEGINNESLIVH
jgi:hypothetical protein